MPLAVGLQLRRVEHLAAERTSASASPLFTSGVVALPDIDTRISYPSPAGHWPLPRADEQEICLIEQPEQGYEPADGSQDAY